MSVDIGERALAKVAHAVENQLTDDELEDMLDEHMGRRGDLELHEIKYDRIEIDLTPDHDRLRVKLKLMTSDSSSHYRILQHWRPHSRLGKADPARLRRTSC